MAPENLNGFGDKYSGGITLEVSITSYMLVLPTGPTVRTSGVQAMAAPGPSDSPGEGSTRRLTRSSIWWCLVIQPGCTQRRAVRQPCTTIWRTANGTTWEPVVPDAFGLSEVNAIDSLIEYNGSLYAALSYPMAMEAYRFTAAAAVILVPGCRWSAEEMGMRGIY